MNGTALPDATDVAGDESQAREMIDAIALRDTDAAQIAKYVDSESCVRIMGGGAE